MAFEKLLLAKVSLFVEMIEKTNKKLIFFKLFVDGRVGLRGNDSFLADSGKNCTEDVAAFRDGSLDFGADVTVGQLEVVPGSAGVVHKREEAVIRNVQELEVHALDVGHVHVVGRWADIFVLLVGEDVDADHVDLGVAVLASLGGRHFDNLAGATLQHDESVFAKSRALHWEGGRGAGVGGGEIVIIGHR